MSFTLSFIHSFTHPSTHSFTYTLIHPLLSILYHYIITLPIAIISTSSILVQPSLPYQPLPFSCNRYELPLSIRRFSKAYRGPHQPLWMSTKWTIERVCHWVCIGQSKGCVIGCVLGVYGCVIGCVWVCWYLPFERKCSTSLGRTLPVTPKIAPV